MSSYEFNHKQLCVIANALGDLLPKVTFVGGCTTVLLVDEAAFSGVRQTEDVDVIIDVSTYLEYQHFSKALRERGFTEDIDGPICRWLYNKTAANIKLDVMTTDEKALGFTNRWYKEALEHALDYPLDEQLHIRVIDPVYFLATKFEAFLDRGKGDYFSHDLEDIVFILENRSGFIHELLAASDELKAYFSTQVSLLLNDDFLNILPGLVALNASPQPVVNLLKIMATWPRERE